MKKTLGFIGLTLVLTALLLAVVGTAGAAPIPEKCGAAVAEFPANVSEGTVSRIAPCNWVFIFSKGTWSITGDAPLLVSKAPWYAGCKKVGKKIVKATKRKCAVYVYADAEPGTDWLVTVKRQ